MRGDLLSGGIPKRLVARDGRWALEVVRQVAVERNVYRPHTQRLEGPDVILGYLRRTAQFSALAHGAADLLSDPVHESRSYEVVNGEWVQSVLAPSYIDELKRQHRASAQRSQHVQLLEVRSECVRLRHANAKLTSRVDELDDQMKQLAALVEELKTRQPVVIQAPVAAPVVEKPVEQVAAAPEEVADPEAAELPKLRLPRSQDFIRCIEQLIGSDVTARESPAQLDVSGSGKFYMSQLIDDNDRLVGAIVMDLQSTVFLGGTLLMVPEAELNSQVRSRTPSEDSVAASSEVCNALSGSLNNVPDNAHIRTKYLEAFNPADFPWVKKPRVQMTLEDSFGGQVLIACR
jgi:hypothetical protein